MAREQLLAQLKAACERGQRSERTVLTIATGYAQFDAALPGGGWPCGAITELMPEVAGIGELSLVLPHGQILRVDRTASPALPAGVAASRFASRSSIVDSCRRHRRSVVGCRTAAALYAYRRGTGLARHAG
jgi:hypothetical protein